MLTSVLSSVTGFIIDVISTMGYPGVSLLMAIQCMAVPMPSEVILPFAGFLASTGRFSLLGIALAGGFGSMMGSLGAYWIGHKGGRPLIERYGRFLLISRHDLDMTESFFAKYGSIAAFLGQLLPIVRSFVAFPAGVARVPVKKFMIFTFSGSFIWSLLLGYIGLKLGENWNELHGKFQKFDAVIAVVIVLLAFYWVYRHVKQSRLAA